MLEFGKQIRAGNQNNTQVNVQGGMNTPGKPRFEEYADVRSGNFDQELVCH